MSSKNTSRNPCKVCNNLDPRGHPSSVYYETGVTPRRRGFEVDLTLHFDAWTLKRTDSLQSNRSRSEDCRYCAVIQNALDGLAPEWRKERNGIVCELSNAKPVKLFLGAKGGKVIEIYRKLSGGQPWETLGTANDISSHSDSDECFEHIKYWISICTSSCGHAVPGLDQDTLPREPPGRLLEVSTSSVKLRSRYPKKSKYIALSHCWGIAHTFATTKATLKSHQKSIALDSLPPLFRDTVQVCLKLNIKYVWIDSLCICQDDPEDWNRESSKMGSIYHGAYLVVASTTAQDSQQRFLHARNQRPISIEFENSKGSKFTLKARLVDDHHPDASTNSPANIKGPLMDRAWVLQERVLGSRVLHYTEHELVFECKERFACECRPMMKNRPTAPALLISPLLKESSKKKGPGYPESWKSLVETYTKCRLTRPSDKLPAISGLAAELAGFDPEISRSGSVDNAYLAGLWRPYILDQLLWSTAPWLAHPHKTELAPPKRAPSFSWASVNSEIFFSHRPPGDGNSSSLERKPDRKNSKGTFVTKFLEGSCTLASPHNKFGETTSGFVKLRGPVLFGTLAAPESSDFEFYYKFRSSTGRITADVEPDSLLICEQELSQDSWVRRAHPSEAGCYQGFKAPVMCLAIAYHESYEMISGLVLTPSVRTDIDGCSSFERVGHFTSTRWPSDIQAVKEVQII